MSALHLHHPERRYELVAEAGNERPPEPPLRVIRRVLRGRWLLLCALSVVLASLTGSLGYRLAPLKYRSTGLVLIEGALSPILYDSQETEIPPMFEAYLSAQMAFITSRAVLDQAVRDPEMTGAGWPAGGEGIAALKRALRVDRGRREQIISVSVTHADPVAAQTAVDAVLRAFHARAQGPPGLSVSTKETALVARESALEVQLQTIREDLLRVSDQYGRDGINRMHTNTIEQLIAIDDKLAELRLRRTQSADGTGDDDVLLPARPGPAKTRSPPLEDRLSEFVAERQSLLARFSVRHPAVRELDRQIASLRTWIELRDAQTVASSDGAGGLAGDATGAADVAIRLDHFEQRYEGIRRELRDQAARLGAKRVTLAGLAEREQAVINQINDTRRRLDEIRVEARQQNLNRVSIAAFGDLPVTPSSDRRAGFAGAGAVLAAGFAFVGMLVFGLVDARARFLDELRRLADAPPLVGVLPRVDERVAWTVQRAGRSVHHLRNLLELHVDDPPDASTPPSRSRPSSRGGDVCAITSSDRNEGRTTLALSISASFAASSRRTLVIDADMGQRGLSRQLGLDGRSGLWDAIGLAGACDDGGPIHATRTENMWAMPTGSERGIDAERLSGRKLIQLLDDLRRRFDMIVIDTGPVLTSVEACLVAAVSDHTLMIVNRGQRLGRIDSSFGRLRQIGARRLGIVFNRATLPDIELWDSAAADVLPSHAAPSWSAAAGARAADAEFVSKAA